MTEDPNTLVGRIVVLKSGSPPMVVEEVAPDGLIVCVLWRHGSFAVERIPPWTVRPKRWWEIAA